MTPRPPLLETAEARAAVEVWAMPARRMGWVMERRVVRGVVRVGVGVGEDIIAGKMRSVYGGNGRGDFGLEKSNCTVCCGQLS